MKVSVMLVLSLAILAAAAAVRSAVLLHKTTGLFPDPGFDGVNTIEQAGGVEQANRRLILGQNHLNEQVSDLNRRAARWAIASAILGVLATLVSLVSCN